MKAYPSIRVRIGNCDARGTRNTTSPSANVVLAPLA